MISIKRNIIILSIVVLVLSVSCFNVFAQIEVIAEYEGYRNNTFEKIEKESIYTTTYIGNINGERYVISKAFSPYYSAIKYNEILEEQFKTEEYVIAGDYYFTRECFNDEAMHNMWGFQINSFAYLYDKELNLIKSQEFDGYVFYIGYNDGKYYCKFLENGEHFKTMVSTDFDVWEESDINSVPRSNSKATVMNNMVTFKQNSDFKKVSYEDNQEKKYDNMFADWFVVKDEENNILISNDNVYFAKILLPENYFSKTSQGFFFNCVYEYENEIIFEKIPRSERLRVPKQEIYAQLEEMRNAPYVQLNDKILGFEVPPVMEDDRMLVPIRFLFEQMGATVEWEEETLTASIESESSTVEFSIDVAVAQVNGTAKTMDVPARLINDKTFIPLRFISENLGYNVEWDESINTAIITTVDYENNNVS